MNILIITEVDSKRNYGGKEKYNRELIKFLILRGNNVTEISLNLNKESTINEKEYVNNYTFIELPFKLSNNLNWKMNKIDKFIFNYCKKNCFDLIISSLHDNLKKTKKIKNFFYVLHNSPAALLGWNNDNIFFSLKRLTKYFLGYTSQFKNLENLVISDIETKKDLIKRSNKYKNIRNIHIIPWPQKMKKQNHKFNYENRLNEVVRIGRIYNRQKNIKFLNKVTDQLEKYKIKLNIYGEGKDKKYLKSKNINFHSWLKNENKLEELSKYKCFILTSNNEGASFVIYESISIGLPVIARETFPSAKYLLQNERGILVSKKDNPKSFALKVKEFINLEQDKYLEVVNKNIDFYQKELDYQKFEKGWDKILKEIKN